MRKKLKTLALGATMVAVIYGCLLVQTYRKVRHERR